MTACPSAELRCGSGSERIMSCICSGGHRPSSGLAREGTKPGACAAFDLGDDCVDECVLQCVLITCFAGHRIDRCEHVIMYAPHLLATAVHPVRRQILLPTHWTLRYCFHKAVARQVLAD